MGDIMYCRVDGKYTKFFLANGDIFIASKSLGDYGMHVLDHNNFFRVHKSYIVNMRFVEKIDKRDGMSCELTNGFTIPISNRKTEQFLRFIRLKNN